MFIGLDYFIDLINDGIGVGGFGCSVLVPDGIEDCLREGQGLAAAVIAQPQGDVVTEVHKELLKVGLACRAFLNQVRSACVEGIGRGPAA